AGSSSASRQTVFSGGAVSAACRKVLGQVLAHVGAQHGIDPAELAVDGNEIVHTSGSLRVPVAEATAGRTFEAEAEFRLRRTEPLDEKGQGDCHAALAFVAHRAVVDVDL